MKIAFFGNPACSNYILVKKFREKTKISVDLLLQDYNAIMEEPCWADLEIRINQKICNSKPQQVKLILKNIIKEKKWEKPDWIKSYPIKYSIYDKFNYKFFDKNFIFKKRINHYVKILKNYDFVVSDAFGAISAKKAKIPYVVKGYGSDFDILPFQKNFVGKQTFNTILNSKAFLATHGATSLKKLNVSHKHVLINSIIDTDTMTPCLKKQKNKFEFFLVARLSFKDKGTDKIIRAFSKLVKKYDAHLFCMDFGTDVEKTRLLINNLGISEHVTFYNFIASKPALNKIFNSHDFVIGDLSSGHFGISELEALACEKQVISNNNEITPIEKGIPILKANSEEEILNQMINLCNNKNLPSGLRDFILKNFNFETFLEKFEPLLK